VFHATKKNYFSDPGTYPLLAIIAGWGGVAAYWINSKVKHHRQDRLARTEHQEREGKMPASPHQHIHTSPQYHEKFM